MRICHVKTFDVMGADPMEASIYTQKVWTPGSTISISFLNGSDIEKVQVKNYANKWLQYANLKFDWIDQGGMVRVKFVPGGGSWAYLGRDALSVTEKREPTVEFGWLDERVVMHEFGHILGLNHNHLSKNFPYHFNKDKVYKEYGGPPNNWDKRTIDNNILNPVRDVVDETPYDEGIMSYYFPKELIVEGIDISPQREISKSEIELVKKWYPKSNNPDQSNLTLLNNWINSIGNKEYLFELKRDCFCYIKIDPRNRYRIYLDGKLGAIQYLTKGIHRLSLIGLGRCKFMIRDT